MRVTSPDPPTGAELDIDWKILGPVIMRHAKPLPAPDPYEVLEQALAGAVNLNQLKSALSDYAGSQKRPKPSVKKDK